MRADLKGHFDSLQIKLEKKRGLLASLLENEKKISELLKYSNDSEDDILKIIENENSIIEDIDVLDFDIASARDSISRLYSLDFSKIFSGSFNNSEEEIVLYRDEILLHRKITAEISGLKGLNNEIMENNCSEILTQINELNRMSKLRYFIPKGPQSS